MFSALCLYIVFFLDFEFGAIDYVFDILDKCGFVRIVDKDVEHALVLHIIHAERTFANIIFVDYTYYAPRPIDYADGAYN
jgi:hypothetical protein